jgi:CRISPR type I-E-associated protein CasB/Cse2
MPDDRPKREREPERKYGFVTQLLEMIDPTAPDRAALAHLRRGLAADDESYTLGRCGWLFQRYADDPRKEKAAVLTAGVFAHAKGKCPQADGVTIGHALRRLPGADEVASIEKRFIDLLDADEADLPHKLRQTVSLLASNGIGLSWHRLFQDLCHWDGQRYPKKVQKEWARGFWSGVSASANANADSDSQPSTVE